MTDLQSLSADTLQKMAADSRKFIWVDANAGSGKTTVLTNRILSILMNNTPPSRILCLTYTRVGASEMIARINKKLMRWTTLSKADLIKELETILNVAVDDNHVTLARQLFARVLDTPGGLKITTIHSLCQSILKRFPIESNTAVGFEVMDAFTELDIKNKAMQQTSAQIMGDEKLTQHMDILNGQIQQSTLLNAFQNMVRNPEKINPLFTNIEATIASTYSKLNIDKTTSLDGLKNDFCAPENTQHLHTLVDDLETLTKFKTAGANAQKIRTWLAYDRGGRAQHLEDHKKIFITEDKSTKRFKAKKPLGDLSQASKDIFMAEAERIMTLYDTIVAYHTAHITESLLRIGKIYGAHYNAQKEYHGRIDFKDMEVKTLNLLKQSNAHLWVMYKMDEGIDHVLVDEAQDTSPIQWQIIDKLTQSFFDQRPADTDVRGRTVFAVGDYKQSIYSFQGASPDEFINMGDNIHKKLTHMDRADDFINIPMQTSFRSTHAILHYVDYVFNTTPARQGVVKQTMHHRVYRKQKGRVEIWPCVPKNEPSSPSPELLDRILSEESTISENKKLAKQLATWAKSIIGKEYLSTEKRLVRAGDILFLLRSRQKTGTTKFGKYLLQELRKNNIPVAGEDRLTINDHIAVQDCIALCRFLLFPADDLNLACVLKSPFVGMDEDGTEDALFQLSHTRKRGQSLWFRLEKLAGDMGDNSHYKHAYDWLKSLLGLADTMPPYELLCHILNQPCALVHSTKDGTPNMSMTGWQALHRRMGDDVDDPVVALLQTSMNFELAGVASLQRFIHHVSAIDEEIKREMEQGVDAVRMMTVHGAKGLESPIVVIPKATSFRTVRWDGDEFLYDDDGTPFYYFAKYGRCAYVQNLKDKFDEKTLEEEHRILYVALTRASERLIITGIDNKQDKGKDEKLYTEGSWYDLCVQGFKNIAPDEENIQTHIEDFQCNDGADDWIGEKYILENMGDNQDTETTPESPPQHTTPPIPNWAHTLVQAEEPDARPLTPSRHDSDDETISAPLDNKSVHHGQDSNPYKRGLLIHRLLESLPDLPPDRWDVIIDAYFAGQDDITDTEKSHYKAEILSVLNHPDLSHVFTSNGANKGANSRAKSELPITGMIGKTPVTARVDRVLIDDNRIVIVDYKTRRHIPPDSSKIPASYVRQLAIYRELLQSIYTNHDISCYIVWTDGAIVMPVDKVMMDTHIKEIKS